jgi:hypothetical protein
MFRKTKEISEYDRPIEDAEGRQGLKPRIIIRVGGTAEAVP